MLTRLSITAPWMIRADADPDGEWVRYADVKAILDEIRAYLDLKDREAMFWAANASLTPADTPARQGFVIRMWEAEGVAIRLRSFLRHAAHESEPEQPYRNPLERVADDHRASIQFFEEGLEIAT